MIKMVKSQPEETTIITEPMTDMTLKDSIYARTAKSKTIPRPKVWKLILDIFRGLTALDAIDLVYCDDRSENTGLIDSITDEGDGNVRAVLFDVGLVAH